MSDRRTAATAAAAADRKSSKPRDSKGAPGAPTTLAAQAVSDGVRAGSRYRMRLLAASIVENVEALRASGVTVAEDAFLMPADSTGEQADARTVLADWQDSAAAGRGYGIGMRDRSRMTERDLTNLADYARRCALKMTRGTLSDDEAEEIEASARTAILDRGGCEQLTCTCGGPAAYALRAPSTDGATVPACFRCADGIPRNLRRALPTRVLLPLWDALTPDDVEGAREQSATREVGITARRRMVANYVAPDRDDWRKFSYLHALRALKARALKLAKEAPADWSDPGEDAPTDAQRAARAADIATEYLTDAVESSAVLTYALQVSAPGAPLHKDEATALTLDLLGCTCKGRHVQGCKGVRRADLAAARGATGNAIAQQAKRGRPRLAARIIEPADAVAWLDDAVARVSNIDRTPTERERLARVAIGAHVMRRSVRLAWPDRAADEDGNVSPIVGAGTRANLPGGGWSREWSATDRPRARWMATGWSIVAPAVLARTATALTTYRRRFTPSALDTSGAILNPPAHPTVPYRIASIAVVLRDPTRPLWDVDRPRAERDSEAERIAGYAAWDAARAAGGSDDDCKRAYRTAIGYPIPAAWGDPDATRAALDAHAARLATIDQRADRTREQEAARTAALNLPPRAPRTRSVPTDRATYAGQSQALYRTRAAATA
jgi:hypothetical protein